MIGREFAYFSEGQSGLFGRFMGVGLREEFV